RSSDRRTSDRYSKSYDNTPGAHSPRDPLQVEALRVLGLEWGASKQAIKQAHRRLVKLHHPDLGGSAEAFRRVSEAYQRLVA
ncbi:MAG: J domain-containing protein, partial [Cyanobacteria bacterium M_surface_10_m1_298]|nr:J domain-containing protein [Cyanobacteria bacterium M_surface_10_m1_298]